MLNECEEDKKNRAGDIGKSTDCRKYMEATCINFDGDNDDDNVVVQQNNHNHIQEQENKQNLEESDKSDETETRNISSLHSLSRGSNYQSEPESETVYGLNCEGKSSDNHNSTCEIFPSHTEIFSTIETTCYMIVGFSSGTVRIYQYKNLSKYKTIKRCIQSENGNGSKLLVEMSDEIETIMVTEINTAVGGSPPLPAGGYLGPAYVRSLPRNINKLEEHQVRNVFQFLVAWLDGRLAHCHITPTSINDDNNDKYEWSK